MGKLGPNRNEGMGGGWNCIIHNFMSSPNDGYVAVRGG